jgi:Phage portal protein, lambda family
MSARKKSSALVRQATAQNLMEVFEGARRGGYRGMFFLPVPMDTSKQMPELTRHTIAKKSILGYNNIPELRAIIDGLAIDEVDTALWPKAKTSSRDFSKAVTNRFHEENKDPRTFDLRQQDSFYGAQFLIRRSIRLLGDLFGQLVRMPFGPPRMAFLPGYQCTSAGASKTDTLLRDGIRHDSETDAPVKYRFARPRQPGSAQTEYTELEALDVLHFHDPFLSDQNRGIGVLAPVTSQMFSMDDIDKAETAGQIMRSRVAYAIETVGAEDTGGFIKLPGVVDTKVIKNPDGSKTIIQKVRTREGNEVDIITPPANMRMRMVESNRGGALEYRNHLARGLMNVTIYPPEWILFLMGLAQGTVARIVQNRVQKIANFFRANQLETQFVSRWYIFWLWKRISAGVFDKVPGGVPNDWWAHKIIYPANMSVDIGREGRLYAELVASGKMSWSDYHALFGRDDEDVDEELVDKIIARKILLADRLAEARKKYPSLEVQFEEIWRPPPGTAAQPVIVQDNQSTTATGSA